MRKACTCIFNIAVSRRRTPAGIAGREVAARIALLPDLCYNAGMGEKSGVAFSSCVQNATKTV